MIMTALNKKYINIAKEIAPIVSSRDVLARLSLNSQQEDAAEVVFDFSDVIFISRSAAHELLSIQENWRVAQRKLELVNMNEEVSMMLRIVAANRAAPKQRQKTDVLKTTDINLLLQEIPV